LYATIICIKGGKGTVVFRTKGGGGSLKGIFFGGCRGSKDPEKPVDPEGLGGGL